MVGINSQRRSIAAVARAISDGPIAGRELSAHVSLVVLT
jgi:hypothetical protein